MEAKVFGQSLQSLRLEKGLTQEDLADMLDSSSRYISFVETGRSHPSRNYLIKMAKALELPEIFCNHILMNAGYAPTPIDEVLSDQDQKKMMRSLQWQAENFYPYPAAVVDRCWDLQYISRSIYEFFDALGINTSFLEQESLNYVDLMLSPDACRPFIYNLMDVEVSFLGFIKAYTLRYPDNPKYKELLERIALYSQFWNLKNINLLHVNQNLFTYTHIKTPNADFLVQDLRISMRVGVDSENNEYYIQAAAPVDASEDKSFRDFLQST